MTSSINPNKVNKNKKDLVSGLKGKSEGKVTSSNKNDVVEQDDDMVMIKKIEKTKEDK